MKFKIGDKFPVEWDKNLWFEDGDFWISGTASINEKRVGINIWVSSIFESEVSIPPLPDKGLLEVVRINKRDEPGSGFDLVVVPEEWRDPKIIADDWLYNFFKGDE